MKPRIFIAIHYMELGGGETSLVGLLHTRGGYGLATLCVGGGMGVSTIVKV